MTKEKIQDAIYTRRYIYNFNYHLIWATKYRHQTFSTRDAILPLPIKMESVLPTGRSTTRPPTAAQLLLI